MSSATQAVSSSTNVAGRASSAELTGVTSSKTASLGLRLFSFIFGVVLIFLFLSASGLDLLPALGLEPFVGSRYSSGYNAMRLLANAVMAILAVGFAFALKSIISAREKEQNVESARIGASLAHTTEIKTKPQIVAQGHDSAERVVENLDRRFNHLSRQSTLIYWTIILSLVAGVFLIVFAGYLSSLDTTLATVTGRLEVQRQNILRQLGLAAEEYYKARESMLSRRTTDSLSDILPEQSQFMIDLKGQLARVDDLYEKATVAAITQVSNRPEYKSDWNWPSTILRIGVIGMLVFLTQILISLYRYNSRLIAFYASRRDAILLSQQGSGSSLKDLAALLLPSNLDFGRQPRHPLQEITNFFRREKGGNGEAPERNGRNRRGLRTRAAVSHAGQAPKIDNADQTTAPDDGTTLSERAKVASPHETRQGPPILG
jgi:hypothetical protein